MKNSLTISQRQLGDSIFNRGFLGLLLLAWMLVALPWNGAYASPSLEGCNTLHKSTECASTGSHDAQHHANNPHCISTSLADEIWATVPNQQKPDHNLDATEATSPLWKKDQALPRKLTFSPNAKLAYSSVPIYLLVEHFLN